MKTDDLINKMKTMTSTELGEYMHISKVTGNAVSVMGVGSILLALVYTNIFTVLIAGIVMFVGGQFACGVDEFAAHISALLNAKINK
jgi:hypothetical protein